VLQRPSTNTHRDGAGASAAGEVLRAAPPARRFQLPRCFEASRDGRKIVLAYWAIRGGGAEWLAMRLGRDRGFTDELAQGCFGIGGDELVATIKPTMTEASSGQSRSIIPPSTGFLNSDAIYHLPDPPREA
jgi:hypothetical protein